MVNKTYKCLWHKAASMALALTLVVTGLSPLAKTYAATSEKATSLEISNPVTVLHLGDSYNLNTDMEPFNNTERTYWKSSNTAIANVDSSGRFTAEKLGVVKITAYTKSGLKSACEILVVSKYGVTGLQSRVDRMLDSDNCRSIYIKNEQTAAYKIEKGRYLGKTLYVEAPLSDVDNYGRFKKVTIAEVAEGTFNEYASGNSFVIKDQGLSFHVAKDASVKDMNVVNNGTKLNLDVEGKLDNLTVSAPSTTLNITGTGGVSDVVVSEKASGATLNVSMPTAITLNTSATVVLSKEAKGTKIVAAGEETKVDVVNNTGSSVTVSNETTGKDEVVVDPEGSEGENSGNTNPPSGSDSGPTTPSNTTKIVSGNYNAATSTATYTLPVDFSNLKSAKVMVDMDRNGVFEKNYAVNGIILSYVSGLLNAEDRYVKAWTGLEKFSVTVGGLSVSVNGVKGNNTKTVSFDGTEYAITLDSVTKSVTLEKAGGQYTYELSKSGSTALNVKSAGNSKFADCVRFEVTY